MPWTRSCPASPMARSEPSTGPLVLWSPPRCRSTAFLRMMYERGDFLVVHEPFSHLKDFGAADVDGARCHDEGSLMNTLLALAERTSVFVKDTTDFHYPGLLAADRLLDLGGGDRELVVEALRLVDGGSGARKSLEELERAWRSAPGPDSPTTETDRRDSRCQVRTGLHNTRPKLRKKSLSIIRHAIVES